ncbi:sigma-70 family RNA polymerase sigma factor [Streptomyces sp. TRM 70351]|uniref:sigma-70 family RNA polymerase sigma factor n=1 Tax=Streptomyces sp. TRM 70351 TaxID=3116552 RepID=UPI002E7AFB80|nr:sigma-70 family RNA polymerase sigma factor [Streptomyces sp. TRM 70351]MEE1929673.1 sigma-70 family RNA polymerase sigma factor [Streptomyces sp. TRM 70351]
MGADHGHDLDGALVSAARAGDPRAVDGLVARSLPLVYNLVGRALDGHQDVDDVVQETLLRVVRGLDRLEDPSAYRAWLVAITVRRIRDWMRDRQRDRQRHEPMDRVAQVPDPASDFASLTVLRLQLDDDRREVVEATRWLEDEQRELLSLWWLEESGQLSRAEVCGALGLSGRHTAVRIQRLREQLDVGRSVVRALAVQPPCPGLAETTATWDARPGPLWRKRIARHLRGCHRCGDGHGRAVPVARLLTGLPLLAPPAVLHRAVSEALGPDAQAADPGRAAPDAHPVPDPHAAAPDASASAPGRCGGSHAAGRSGRRRRREGPRRYAGTAAAAVATAVVVLGAWALLPSPDGGPAPAAAPGPAPLTSAPAAPAAPATPPTAAPAASGGAGTAGPARSAPPSSSAAAAPTPAPDPSPSGRRAATGPGATAPVVTTSRKGVGVWSFPGAAKALDESGAGWYYTWSTAHPGVPASAGAQFIPMIWGADSVTPQALAEAEASGPYLLGFNEPDFDSQADMSVEQALDLWPRLESTGSVLGSPAVAFGGDQPGGWLDRFMTGAEERGLRVDFIALHWYGADFRTEAAVEQLRGYLDAVHERYGKPVWLTEFALIDFSQGTRFPTDEEQAAFLASATKMLAGLPYLQRYAWFGLGTDETGPGTTLFRDGSTVTPQGRAFRSAP